jgi:hypothetical protein
LSGKDLHERAAKKSIPGIRPGGRRASCARAFCSQDWFWDELASYRSRGCPIWDSTSELKFHHAKPCEAAELQIAVELERFRKEYDGYVFAFLVPVDADLQ